LGASVQRVQTLTFVQVPQHGDTILATRGTEGTVWGDGDSVEVTSVADQFSLELEVLERPDLDGLVPTSRDEEGVVGGWGEADTRDPISVGVFSGQLAFTNGVPDLDALVTGTRDDLTVVSREGNRENILGVGVELTGGFTSGEIPETQAAVPRRGQTVLAIRR
jgi:hypothetical protein